MGHAQVAQRRYVHYHAYMGNETPIAKLLESLDTGFVKAFDEPARLEILKLLLMLGPSDVKTLSEKMPQDRSVISRHLSVLHTAGFLNHEKQGRHAIYSVDGDNTLRMIDELATVIRKGLEQGCC